MRVIIFCSILLFFGIFLLADFGFTATTPPPELPPPGELPPEEPPPCVPGPAVCDSWVSDPFRCDDFAVYKCANNSCGKAGGSMEQGIKWYMCQTTTESCSDGCDSSGSSQTNRISGPHGPEQVKPYGKVPDYQICPAVFNEWGPDVPLPECSGSCYLSPNLKPLDDPGLSPKNVSESSKYKLPINFGWEDNVEKEVIKAPNFCTVGSYEFSIVKPPLSEIVSNTHYDQLSTTSDLSYRLECQLKSNTDYQWRARACLDAGGADCGEWPKNQNFKTSYAPELVGPYDPDWAGNAKEGSTSTPVTLDWCDIEEAESYQIKINIVEGGKEICHPWLTVGAECQPLRISKKEAEGKTKWLLLSQFEDEKEGYFTKDTHYKWQVGVAIENLGNFFGQAWEFVATGLITDFELIFPPNDPAGLKPVGLPLVLDWRGKPGANSFVYEISPTAGGNPITGVVLPSEVSFDYPKLNLDAFYKWKVWPCWDYTGKQCEEEFRGDWTFKTTGRPPQLDYPASDGQDVRIPVNFKWEAVPGAKSYVLKVSGDGLNFEKAVDESEFSLDYPEYNIRQEKNYSWQVKTCAWKDGQTCGQFSPAQSFKTFRLPPPQNPFPENNGRLSTDEKYVSWQKIEEAKAYQYKIKYLTLAAAEENEECKTLAGQEVVPQKIVPTNSNYVQLNCLGGYQWQANACLDGNCTETSNWSGPWTFGLAEPIEVGKGGLVPCGRAVDNLNTPWNEREPCQIKHIFLLIKVLIDFLLLRMAPIILVLLTVATAVMLYPPISTGGAAPLARIKSLWKSAGIGIVLIFFAWTLVNLILKLIGYQVGIFGNWYQI